MAAERKAAAPCQNLARTRGERNREIPGIGNSVGRAALARALRLLDGEN